MHKKNEIWLANLDPRFGTEAGKTRPVLIVQTDLLKNFQIIILVRKLYLIFMIMNTMGISKSFYLVFLSNSGKIFILYTSVV